MKWFKHDTDANTDAKLVKLRMRYGMEGYGLYWYCLEMIAGSIEAHNLTFELEHDAEVLAFNTGLHQDKVEHIMRYMCEVGLFEQRNNIVTCLKLAKRMDSSMTSNPKMRKLFQNIENNHDGVMTLSAMNHDGVMTGSCKKEEKEEKEEKRTLGRFTPPSESEVSNRIKEMGYKYSKAEDFCNFYGSKNWMVGKNKMTDWHKALGGWESRKKKDNGSGEAYNPFTGPGI